MKMKRYGQLIALACICMLSTAGCSSSSGGDSTAGEAGSAVLPNTLPDMSVAEAINVSYPFSDLMDQSTPEARIRSVKTEQAIAECMRGRGFEYKVVPDDAAVVRFQAEVRNPPQFASVADFMEFKVQHDLAHLPQQPSVVDGPSPVPEGLSGQEEEAWSQALTGGPDDEEIVIDLGDRKISYKAGSCVWEVDEAVYGSSEEATRLSNRIQQMQGEILDATEGHPQVQEARKSAEECLNSAFPEDERNEFNLTVSTKTQGAPLSDEILSRAEAMTRKELECQISTGYLPLQSAGYDLLEKEYEKKYESLFLAYREMLNSAVEEQ